MMNDKRTVQVLLQQQHFFEGEKIKEMRKQATRKQLYLWLMFIKYGCRVFMTIRMLEHLSK